MTVNIAILNCIKCAEKEAYLIWKVLAIDNDTLVGLIITIIFCLHILSVLIAVSL